MAQATRPPDRLAAGHAALSRGAWEEARDAFEAALSQAESAAAWEGLSWAAWWLEDGGGAIRAREEAHRLYREAGDVHGVARMAIWLGNDRLEFHGAEAVAGGWFERAGRMLAELDPCAEQAWLAAIQAFMTLQMGDTAGAKELAARTRELGHGLGLVGLEMLGLATEGLVLVSEGAVETGMRQLDEATAAALAGEYEELPGAAWSCCYLIYACERVRDYDRAAQWSREVEEFAARRHIDFLNGTCRAHYAAVLTWHGRWKEAELMLAGALGDLLGTRPYWASEAAVRLGDLRRRQGLLDDAEDLFVGVEWHPLACLGLGELALERGDPDRAVDLAERLLNQVPPDNRTERVGPLELMTRARLARGEHAAAAECAAELRSIAGAVPTEPLRAAAGLAEGAVARAEGDLNAARRALDDATELYRRGGAPFETARARLELAGVLTDLGRVGDARHEAGAALSAFEGLGAQGDIERGRKLVQRLGPKNGRGRAPLTAREVEVLALIARGLSDKEIAGELTISRHTVHRHVANVLAKLSCSTRASAVDEANRRRLL